MHTNVVHDYIFKTIYFENSILFCIFNKLSSCYFIQYCQYIFGIFSYLQNTFVKNQNVQSL